MENGRNAVVDLYINSRLADYALRIANTASYQTRKRLERERDEFERKHHIKPARI